MTLLVEALELEVLRLPTLERARLLDRVIASLDADKARDKAWDNLPPSAMPRSFMASPRRWMDPKPSLAYALNSLDILASPRRGT